MNIKQILVPLDFSESGKITVEMAASLARDRGAVLEILHVEEPPLAYGGGEMYYGIPEPDHQAIRQMLNEVRPHDPGLEVVHRLAMGDPSEAIVRIAEEDECDLIIISTHGRTGLTRMLLGSVAELVVRRAKCPVLTVKPRLEQDVPA